MPAHYDHSHGLNELDTQAGARIIVPMCSTQTYSRSSAQRGNKLFCQPVVELVYSSAASV